MYTYQMMQVGDSAAMSKVCWHQFCSVKQYQNRMHLLVVGHHKFKYTLSYSLIKDNLVSCWRHRDNPYESSADELS